MTMRMLPFKSAIADPNPARDVTSCPWCGCVDLHRDLYGVRCRDCGAARDSVADRIERDRAAHAGGPRIVHGC